VIGFGEGKHHAPQIEFGYSMERIDQFLAAEILPRAIQGVDENARGEKVPSDDLPNMAPPKKRMSNRISLF